MHRNPVLLGGSPTESTLRRGSERPIWRLALPVLGENLLGMFVGWSDTILTGRILVEKEYLAAIAVAGYLIWLVQSAASLIGTGSHAVVARLIGAGEAEEAGRITLQSLVLAGVLGSGLGLVVWVAADAMVGAMSLSGIAASLAAHYLRIVALSCPMMMVMLVGCTCLRAAGNTLAGMWIISAVNLINITSSWLLALGWGPIPALGWSGVALGTAVAYGAGGLGAMAMIGYGRTARLAAGLGILPDLQRTRRILRIGVPGAANSMAVVLFHLWFVGIIGRLGDASLAAHGVAIRCESVSFLAGEAFAVAAATLVGQSLGARQPEMARWYGWRTFRTSALVMSAMGAAFYAGARSLMGLFVQPQEAQVLELGVPVLRLVAFAMPALAASIVLSGALRGAGDTRGPLLYNVAGLLLVRIPLAYLLTSPWAGLGLYGAWIAMVVDLYARGLMAALRFASSGWSRRPV